MHLTHYLNCLFFYYSVNRQQPNELTIDHIELIDRFNSMYFVLNYSFICSTNKFKMIKNFCILAFTLFSVCIYGQKTTFQKNANNRAKGLEQILNKKGDSLTLRSEKTISQVDIFNDDYMKSIDVNGNETKIDLSTLPLGKFVVQARLDRKRIVMYLERHEFFKEKTELNVSEESTIASTIIEEKSLESPKKTTTKPEKKPVSYWVVYESNSGSGSYKSMSLERKEVVSEMISKNKLELNTEIGKNNKLIVYEVYNTSKFMRKQLRNPKYFNTSKSKFFNVDPYYVSPNHDVIVQ